MVIAGYKDGTFRPYVTCTIQQIILFIWRACGCPDLTNTGVCPFADEDLVPGTEVYKAAIWAYRYGIWQGDEQINGDRYFHGSKSCTRARAVTFLYQLWKLRKTPPVEFGENPFTDVPEGEEYTCAVLWAKALGITGGYTENSFGVNIVCNRGQIVTFLFRYANLVGFTWN